MYLNKKVSADTQSFWVEPQDPGFTLLEFKPRTLQLMRPGTIEILRADL
jgi:hypothetical protein